MASHDERGTVDRSVAKWLLVAKTVCLLSLFATACSASASGGSASDAPSEISDFLGKDVMISFRWKKPTSVLVSLTLAGTLVRVEEEFVTVDIEKSVRSREQERVVEALKRNGKIKRDPDGHSVYVLRGEIADLRLGPEI